jgi:hypothetical protein
MRKYRIPHQKMDGRDIWQCICKFLDLRTTIRLGILSKRHQVISLMMAKTKPLLIDNDETLRQMFAWIIINVEMESLKSSTRTYPKSDMAHADDPTIICSYGLQTIGSSIDDYLENQDDDLHRIIPQTLGLDTPIHLLYNLQMENPYGPNTDSRGMNWPNVEIGDFHDIWIWKAGITTISKLAEGLFRLKSHKFENWYEWIHTKIRPRHNNPNILGYHYPMPYRANIPDNETLLITSSDGTKKFWAQLSADHGS